MDVLDNDFLVDKEFEEIAKRCNKRFAEFWYNRIYSFRNVCIQIEENRFRHLVEINKRIEQQNDFYDYLDDDGYSTEEEIDILNYNYDDIEDNESDSN